MACGEMSMPWMWREGMARARRVARRSAMQPVPVQRSRMVRCLRGGVCVARRCARWVV